MNPNVLLPRRVDNPPWTGKTITVAAALHPGDVVLGRDNSCGACTVVSRHMVKGPKGDRYVVFYCCGGQWYKVRDHVTIAYPHVLTNPGEPTPQHPLDTCDFSVRRHH